MVCLRRKKNRPERQTTSKTVQVSVEKNMTSLKGSLPPAGSALWQKERRSSSVERTQGPCSIVTHVVIREVWQQAIPSPHALYKINVITKSNHWFVLRRYREFSELHKNLVHLYGIPKDMLPPKKLTSRLSMSHLEKRREALEHYLQRLVNSSTYVSSSQEILDFLDLDGHDVMAVTKDLARDIFKTGDAILADREPFTLTPTQLYCITRQLQLPEPLQASEERATVDLGNLYSFIYQLEHLCVSSVSNKSKHCQELASHLEFDISLFKSLRTVRVDGCPAKLINGLSALQGQLKYLTIRYCIKTMRELLVDRVCKKRRTPAAQGSVATWRSQMTERLTQNRVVVQPWFQLTNLNLSHNKITMIDNSLKLMPVLQSLDLSFNEFVSLDLQQLDCPSLTQLDVSHNSIHFISGTPRDLRHLKSLILSHNRLQSLSGLECVIGLIGLDITDNQVSSVKEMTHLVAMSQLRYLALNDNPLTKNKSYRVEVFLYFKGRELVLDNKPRTLKEKVHLNHHPTRPRSRTSPELFSNEEMQYVLRHVRSHSYEAMGNPLESDDDNDSGIEGNIPSIHVHSRGVNPLSVATVNEELGLTFNWSYYDSMVLATQMESTSEIAGRQLEVLGREEVSEGQSGASRVAELAMEERANGEDAYFPSRSHVSPIAEGFTDYSNVKPMEHSFSQSVETEEAEIDWPSCTQVSGMSEHLESLKINDQDKEGHVQSSTDRQCIA